MIRIGKRARRTEASAATTRCDHTTEHLLHEEAEHRWLNHLQLVTTNLERANRRMTSPEARSALEAAAEQLHAVGKLHRLLGTPTGPMEEDAETKLRDLCATVDQLVLAPRGHALMFAPDESAKGLRLPSHLAQRLALLVNEMVVNAAKHAFPARSSGRIEVVLARAAAGTVSCTVRDDGVGGLPITGRVGARGMALVRSLAEQAGGRCRWVFGMSGTEAYVELPLEPLPCGPVLEAERAANGAGAWRRAMA